MWPVSSPRGGYRCHHQRCIIPLATSDSPTDDVPRDAGFYGSPVSKVWNRSERTIRRSVFAAVAGAVTLIGTVPPALAAQGTQRLTLVLTTPASGRAIASGMVHGHGGRDWGRGDGSRDRVTAARLPVLHRYFRIG